MRNPSRVAAKTHSEEEMKPKYSICMCNYNMADTLDRSLTSILEQLDDHFEVLVVDDGSSDNSVEVLESLQQRYPRLRILTLDRDPKRKVGQTRNISIQNAQGEYVLLHLDCDDVYQPFITDFTKVFHRIEQCIGKDILLSGQHINMGKRDFLIEHGPYYNISGTEDRNMWVRFAAIGRYIPFNHIDFVTRIPLPRKKQMIKALRNNWVHFQNDFRSGSLLKRYIYYELKKWDRLSWRLRLYRLLIIGPACFLAKFKTPLPMPENMRTHEDFVSYREKTRGSYSELMSRHSCDPDLSFLDEDARKIFY